MPPSKAVNKISRKINRRLYLMIRKSRIRLAPIRLEVKRFSGFCPQSHYLFHSGSQVELVQQMHALGCSQQIVDDARAILSHRFNLLGSGVIQLGESIPWHEDFKTDFRWENQFYKDIPIVDLANAADVKVPWELSRFQHFFTMGKAYWLTGDETYALEFSLQIEDWILQNPLEMSVNWTCPMDVAIRALNWIAGYHFFETSPSIPQAFWQTFYAALFQHGQYIFRNLENEGDRTGNHYLFNVAGLIGLGLFFKGGGTRRFGVKDAARWLEYGIRELKREMLVQVNEDGTHYEASTAYHRLVTECFLVTTILCRRNGICFSEEFMRRLEKMCEFIWHTQKPDGRTPLIGDADDGRLLIVSRYGSWIKNDFRHVLAIAGELFERDEFRQAGYEFAEDALWISGALDIAASSRMASIPKKSIAFPEGGYYVLRHEQAYCLIRCGELSFHGQGAHSHNDQLSFELQIRGQDVFVDPGSYVYTADFRQRNLFRSTESHNTVRISGMEQNAFVEHELFELKEETFGVCEHFRQDYFKGSHQGYAGKCGIIHHREFTLGPCELQIRDYLHSHDSREICLDWHASFIISPEMKVEERESKMIIYNPDISVELLWDGPCRVERGEWWVSESYGTRKLSQVVRIYPMERRMRVWIRWEP